VEVGAAGGAIVADGAIVGGVVGVGGMEVGVGDVQADRSTTASTATNAIDGIVPVFWWD
jgi:hypothetical protein